MSNYYKIFFTIYFDYAESKNKTITRFFKSDVDLGPTDFDENVNDDNIFKWDASIIGPSNTPYEGGLFYLTIDFPQEYPFKPPIVKFINGVLPSISILL